MSRSGTRQAQAGRCSGSAVAAIVALLPLPVLLADQHLPEDRLRPLEREPPSRPSPTLDNYTSIFEDDAFTKALRNSAIIAGSVTALSLLIGSFAGYALARLHLPFKFLILAILLSISTFPPIAIAAPVFEIWTDIGLYNTYLGLILPSLAFGLPLTVYILASFFRDIPQRARGGGADRRGHALPGLPQDRDPARRARRGHRRPAGLHLRLERVPLRDHADQHARPAPGARGDRLLHRQPAVRDPAGDDQRRVGRRHRAADRPGADLPAPHRRRPHRRAP